jgi:cell division septum initiation protein DivIVA
MTHDPEELLREAEDEIEAWLCELDEECKQLRIDAESQAESIVEAAEARATELLEAARAEADVHTSRSRASAEAEASEILDAARAEAERILAQADELAGEHVDVIRALTTAEQEAVGEELAGLREAVTRLRAELSRVVDAAFDAIPAVEATAEAIDRAIEENGPVKRGMLRRLLRR